MVLTRKEDTMDLILAIANVVCQIILAAATVAAAIAAWKTYRKDK